MSESWWSHRTIGEMVSYGGSLMLALLAFIARRVHKIHKVVVQWNGHRVTVDHSKASKKSE